MLKKILVVISAMVLMVSLLFLNNSPLFKNYSKNYEIYLDNYSNSSAIITVNNNKYPFVFSKKGESVCIEKESFKLPTFLLEMNARIVFSEEFDGKISYYAYSPKIKYIQRVKNQNINLHIVVSESLVKVGSPIIYGSF